MQSNATTPSVTGTDGTVVTNKPVVIDNTLRAEPTEVTLEDSKDCNKYPAISIQTVTSAVQYWVYNLGDTATRDADLATF